MFAILAGVDASSKTSFLTNLSKVDDKIVSFFCHKRMDGLVCFKIVKNGRSFFNCDKKMSI